MGMYFSNIEIPENCGKCRFVGCCGAHPVDEWPDIESIIFNDVIGVDGRRDEKCPFISVPTPHGKLIDADRLGKIMCEGLAPSERDSGFKTKIDILRAILDAPTVIPAEGKEE